MLFSDWVNNDTNSRPFSFLNHPCTIQRLTLTLCVNPESTRLWWRGGHVWSAKIFKSGMFPLTNSWCHSSCISCTIFHPDWPQPPGPTGAHLLKWRNAPWVINHQIGVHSKTERLHKRLWELCERNLSWRLAEERQTERTKQENLLDQHHLTWAENIMALKTVQQVHNDGII